MAPAQSFINKSSLSAIFSKFSDLKIVVVGDVMLDAYLWGNVDRISPEAPVPVVAIKRKEERPGGAANVALNVKELGAIPIVCSVIGKDGAGKALYQILKRAKISTDGVVISSERITSVKTRLLSKSHQLLRYDSEMASDLNGTDEKSLLAVIQNVLVSEKPEAVIFQDYNKGVLTKRVITQVLDWCRKAKIFSAVDPKRKNFFSYRKADLFKPNLREIREALNQEIIPVNESTLKKIHQSLRKKLQHKDTMITLSESGIYFNDGRLSGIVPGNKHDVSDVSGAGDTVIATAVAALSAGLSLQEAATLANMAGGLVCEHSGVVPITREMLLEQFT